MDTRFYAATNLDLEKLAAELERTFTAQGYQVQHFGNRDQMTVQMKKGGDVIAILGMQSALTLVMQRAPDGMRAMIGQQKWADKAAVGAVGLFVPFLWPLMLTAGAGAVMQATLAGKVMNALDMLVYQQNPDARPAPAPDHMSFPSQWLGKQPSNTVTCPNCKAENEAGDSYCANCGKPLTQEKVHCTNCGAEVCPGAAFCTKCGTEVAAE